VPKDPKGEKRPGGVIGAETLPSGTICTASRRSMRKFVTSNLSSKARRHRAIHYRKRARNGSKTGPQMLAVSRLSAST